MNGHHRLPRVVVSAGGGSVGEPVLRSAVEAQPQILDATGMHMRVITGPFLPEETYASLRKAARSQKGLIVRRFVPDLVAELRQARVSISQCGYNTALDIVQARVPALVVPVLEDGDEETRRAKQLEDLGIVRVLPRERLDRHTLTKEICALAESRPGDFDFDLDGARASTNILADLNRWVPSSALRVGT